MTFPRLRNEDGMHNHEMSEGEFGCQLRTRMVYPAAGFAMPGTAAL